MDMTKRLEKCYAAAVHDVLRGHGARALRPAARPSSRSTRPGNWQARSTRSAATSTRPGIAHDTLVQWTGLLSKAPAGKVMVCQPNTHHGRADGRAVRRDAASQGRTGLCRGRRLPRHGLHPEAGLSRCSAVSTRRTDIVGRWVPDRFGQPVTIGDVTISTGDWLLADRDGVVIIPGKIAEQVVSKDGGSSSNRKQGAQRHPRRHGPAGSVSEVRKVLMNKFDFKGRVAVVTGAARGLGLAITERLLEGGAAVSMWDMDRATLDAGAKQLGAKGRIHTAVVDVVNESQVEQPRKPPWPNWAASISWSTTPASPARCAGAGSIHSRNGAR